MFDAEVTMKQMDLSKSMPLSIVVFMIYVICMSGCRKEQEWHAFHYDSMRTSSQPNYTALSAPAKVPNLAVRWTWTAPAPGPGGNAGFRASPVVNDNIVYIGNGNGFFYALNGDTGALLWQYPPIGSPALVTQFKCNPSSFGIASSAVITDINGTDAVIFAAPDQSIGMHLGDSRLFALNAKTGAEIWKSPVIARLTGLNSGSKTEFHENIGYSSPVVFNSHVYVGIGDQCDNPIQKGRVVAVRLDTGAIDGAFTYCSTGTCADSTRGGGVWSPVAAASQSVYITTGNVKSGDPTEPSPNNGLSMIKLDQNSGAIIWKFQPVPWVLDGDPDWSAGATIMSTSCGTVVISTMKDGWTHALNDGPNVPGPPSRRWSFPPATIPFTPGDGTSHGDTRYMRGGAAWGDVYIAMNGGLNLTISGVSGGYKRLHAFNVCAAEADRLRWLIDVPNASGATYSLGHPTVTNGIVYVGTDLGHLVAIADPSLFPAAGFRCSNPDVPNASCIASGYKFVPQPAVLKDIALSGRMVYNEPVLANGRVYVATEGNNVYMLSP
jgi:outer membrane protein assembly factor BamB